MLTNILIIGTIVATGASIIQDLEMYEALKVQLKEESDE
jgi:hypothetical protein